jgi:hypothetical protein
MARQTKKQALYEQIKASGKLTASEMRLYDVLFHHGPKTKMEIWEHIHRHGGGILPSDADYTNMRRMGIIQEGDEVLCEVSNQNCFQWKITRSFIIEKKQKVTKEEKARQVFRKAVERINKLGFVVKAENGKIVLIKTSQPIITAS